MKNTMPIFFFLFMSVSSAFAGQIVYKNMYAKHTLLQGVGATTDDAKKDALTALPSENEKGKWMADPKNSPEIECSLSKTPKAGKCNSGIVGDELRITIPIVFQTKG